MRGFDEDSQPGTSLRVRGAADLSPRAMDSVGNIPADAGAAVTTARLDIDAGNIAAGAGSNTPTSLRSRTSREHPADAENRSG